MSLALTIKPGEYVEVTPPTDASQGVRVYNNGSTKVRLRFEAAPTVEIHLVTKGEQRHVREAGE